MAEYNSTSPPNIAALPPTTVSQLGSSNVLSDPSSVVKELIDNALDARTNAIFVDITANTLDSIQVKDTGHGISAEDRPLVCRRYCTSKIRDFHDLGEVGGKWLGFRGEALASMAEMSGVLEVTTRVEGELVAVKLKYGRDGGLQSTEHASAPVGTAVKVTNFFQTLPVRRETALKESAKTLAKIKRLMQAYAFARPTVRFSLRVLKAKSNKGDFMNAPKKDANVEDAVLKIIGKHCALQCDWTAMESEGFEIHAFLPKPDAVGSKIANEGAFFSVDGRPVSASRGTPKKIVASFKERLRRANPGLSSVRDPLFCINITCPPGSYDTNIEPAKDDVLFEREDIVVGAVTKLFAAYYPENAVVSNVDDEPESPVPPVLTARVSSGTALSILEEVRPVEKLHPPVSAPLRWRSNMYGIDEEDLELLDSENQPPVIEEEEEGRRAANVSNPWTIARMNAKVKTPQSKSNGQLMTPAKTHADVTMSLTSPAPSSNTHQPLLLEPLTQTVSRTNVSARPRDSVLQGSMERPSQIAGPGFQVVKFTRRSACNVY
ncbi:hypothetical protein BU23DRAFT_530447 [Bimuria novae-zelandiae CBS 107.79]|uniref:DNA mismatch repair protein S5 domain-containing protein n=1 Tax=Bimuria novae-zelandiae CBS 107.79 TaxID=1447943 RepID=A0A6A5VEN6_9PLEO|nr:hypothetical protein BU23DRAFT_530447 [Bimuria novae-zelandiae CBS 107.79]